MWSQENNSLHAAIDSAGADAARNGAAASHVAELSLLIKVPCSGACLACCVWWGCP